MKEKELLSKALKILKKNLEKTLKEDIKTFNKFHKRIKKEISSGIRRAKGTFI